MECERKGFFRWIIPTTTTNSRTTVSTRKVAIINSTQSSRRSSLLYVHHRPAERQSLVVAVGYRNRSHSPDHASPRHYLVSIHTLANSLFSNSTCSRARLKPQVNKLRWFTQQAGGHKHPWQAKQSSTHNDDAHGINSCYNSNSSRHMLRTKAGHT